MDFNSGGSEMQPQHSNPNNNGHLLSNDHPHSQFYDAQQQSSAAAAASSSSSSSNYYAQYSYYPPQQSQNPNPNNSIPIPHHENPSLQFDSGSDTVLLHPPTIDPYAAVISYNIPHVGGGGGGYEAQAAAMAYSHQPTQTEVYSEHTYYQDPSIAQYGVDPVAYAAEIKSLDENTIVPTKRSPKETNVIRSMTCEVCRIDCNSEDVLDRHKKGKKHKMNVVKQAELCKDSTAISDTPTALKTTEKKGFPAEDTKIMQAGAAINSVMVCTVCKVTCNSESVFQYHIAGKKHAAQVKKEELGKDSTAPAISKMPTTPETTKKSGLSGEDLETEKQNAMEAGGVNCARVCTICKVTCNSQLAFDYHITGKKHAAQVKKEELGKDSNAPVISKMPSTPKTAKKRGLPGEDLETKKRKIMEAGGSTSSVMVCTVCEVACNSQSAFHFHLAGKKHAVQAGLTPANGMEQMVPANLNPVDMTAPMAQPPIKMSMKKGPKKIKIVQSAWCEICKIDCTTKDVLDIHIVGKKHKKNLKKLEESSNKPSAVTTSTNPIIGPQVNPNPSSSVQVQQTNKRPAPSSSVPVEDVETKRRKLMEGGAAAGSVRICSICNVVVNSETVFSYHLAGQKHAAMVKKQAGGTTAATAPGVVTVA